ncbi:ATP-binding protein [Chryseobacterium sp. G0162]|uniref:SMEK domain-containing protein n=1 Tax=Chryseobacterium sp. G0162 TaxID=2487063 RepID=UPI000F4F0AC5|nr:SMEK domain-containing protein [Chryseobacterium sp. G0162]AZB10699.1 ATP-binding protein [Chryseobacterium sp. G0162]
MSKPEYFQNITKYLINYVAYLEYNNSLGLSDYTIFAEHSFKDILNKIFGWNLVNANFIKKNQSSYDLLCEKNGVFVQVTSNKKHKQKYDSSIQSFKKLNVRANRFIVLFIRMGLNKQLLESVKENGITYEAFDVPKLLDYIFENCSTPGKFQEINEILEEMLQPTMVGSKKHIPIKLPEQKIMPLSNGIYVDRSRLVEDLFSFVQNDNGLLIGGPGYGKSYILEELQRYCVERSVNCYLIRINDLTTGTYEEIGEELKVNRDWLGVLGQLKHSEHRSILIFDAYDTAKDGTLKANIMKAIKKSLSDLGDDWRVLVSVRTYDATKSIKLLEMFPNGNINRQFSCRYFDIPQLLDTDVEAALDAIPEFKNILKKCNEELRKLLRIPYFLNIFYLILNGDRFKVKTFIDVQSEEELLNKFWTNKIDDSLEKIIFLKKMTAHMAEKQSLSCDLSLIVNEQNTAVLHELISSGIVEEVSITKQKIAFTHNILLDFAIAKFLLQEQIKEQVNYVQKNEKMPFIFRQAFIYFYSKLYRDENATFWQHYFKIAEQDSPIFRLFHQTSLIYVLVNLYRKAEDIDIIYLEQDTQKRASIIKKVLEVIRFITKGNLREKDVDLLLRVSSDLHISHLWEIGILIQNGIEQFSGTKNSKMIAKLSAASFLCFDFILEKRKELRYKNYVDRNGGWRIIHNLCRTLPCNSAKVEKYFKRILLLLKEEDFPITYFNELAENITTIFLFKRGLAVKIYKTLYFHVENSDRVTNFGTSALVLRSNRKQDFSMIHYILEEKFNELLEIDFDEAMRLGFSIYELADNGYEGYRYRSAELKVGKLKSKIRSDYSRYDFDEDKGPSSYADRILQFVFENFNEKKNFNTGVGHIESVIPEIVSAMLWRRLIKNMVKYPEAIEGIAYQVLIERQFYIFDETLFECGELLNKVWPYFSKAKKQNVENVIIALLKATEFDLYPGMAESRVNQLLNCIPFGNVISDAAKEILDNQEKIPNQPLIQHGNLLADVSFATREEKIIRLGFSLDSMKDMLNFEKIEELEAFNNRFADKHVKPVRSDYQNIMSYLESLFLVCQQWPEMQKISFELEIARFLSIFSEQGKLLNAKKQGLAKRIAMHYINDPCYQKEAYEEGDLKDKWGVYGPTARNISVRILLKLLHAFGDKEIQGMVADLMADNEKITRYFALAGLPYFWRHDKGLFWKIVEERSRIEGDGMSLNKLMLAVCHNDIMDADPLKVEDFVASVLQKMSDSLIDPAQEYWRVLVVIMLKMVVFQKSVRMGEIIRENLGVKPFVNGLIFEIMKTIDPHSEKNNYIEEPAKYEDLLGLVMSIAEYQFEMIQDPAVSNGKKSDAYEVVYHLIMHLYFTVDRGKGENKNNSIGRIEKLAFYHKIKPVITYIVEQLVLEQSGNATARAGFYLMQMINSLFELDPQNMLSFTESIVCSSSISGFTNDYSMLKEIIKMTEAILTDYRELLDQKENFNNLISILDYFSNSGWQEAMEMTWRIKEAF